MAGAAEIHGCRGTLCSALRGMHRDRDRNTPFCERSFHAKENDGCLCCTLHHGGFDDRLYRRFRRQPDPGGHECGNYRRRDHCSGRDRRDRACGRNCRDGHRPLRIGRGKHRRDHRCSGGTEPGDHRRHRHDCRPVGGAGTADLRHRLPDLLHLSLHQRLFHL